MSNRGESIPAMRPLFQEGEGGSTPTSPLFHKRDWIVDASDLRTAQQMVAQHHYSGGGSNTKAYVHGLYRNRHSILRGRCYGVAWWLPPTRTAAKSFCPENPGGVLALSRLVILPEVPTNACSFLMRHALRFIDRQRWPVLCSYACESQGHLGTIYLAAGWSFVGWTKPQPLYAKDGKHVSRKIGPKTRTHQQMLDIGCVCLGHFRKRRFVLRAA
jgi:hypothetical protein